MIGGAGGVALDIGDLVLVKKTAWKGKHKIQDRWESDEYQVIGQPTPGIPVYKVKCIAGGRTMVLHHNLLLPLQGRLRQAEEQGGKVPQTLRKRKKKIVSCLVCHRHPRKRLGRGLHLSQPHLHYPVRPLGRMPLVKHQRKLLLLSLCLKDSSHYTVVMMKYTQIPSLPTPQQLIQPQLI